MAGDNPHPKRGQPHSTGRRPSAFDELLKPRANATWQSLAWPNISSDYAHLLCDLDKGTWGLWQRTDMTLYACGPGGIIVEIDAAHWPSDVLEIDYDA